MQKRLSRWVWVGVSVLRKAELDESAATQINHQHQPTSPPPDFLQVHLGSSRKQNPISCLLLCKSAREADSELPLPSAWGRAGMHPARQRCASGVSPDRACRSCMPFLHAVPARRSCTRPRVSLVRSLFLFLTRTSTAPSPGWPTSRLEGEPQAWSLRSRVPATAFCHGAAPGRQRARHAVFPSEPWRRGKHNSINKQMTL